MVAEREHVSVRLLGEVPVRLHAVVGEKVTGWGAGVRGAVGLVLDRLHHPVRVVRAERGGVALAALYLRVVVRREPLRATGCGPACRG